MNDFDDAIAELDAVRLAADNERLKRRNAWLNNALARSEATVEELGAELAAATAIRNADTQIPKWAKPKKGMKQHHAVPVLLLSDLHFGEVVDSDAMDGVNAYNDTVAVQRWERIINQTPEAMRRHLHGYRFDHMIVGLLGDILSGDIHDELIRTNDAPTPVTVQRWVPRIAAGLKHLADELDCRLLVPCVDGNHDRTYRKPQAKSRMTSSWAFIVYSWLADHLRDDDRISFLIPESSQVRVPVADQWMLCVHGDGTKGGQGIGGIWPPIKRYVAKTMNNYSHIRQPIDLVAMGHWHSLTWSSDFVINGSLKGWDEWARGMGFAPDRPQQALFAVAQGRGIVMQTSIHGD